MATAPSRGRPKSSPLLRDFYRSTFLPGIDRTIKPRNYVCGINVLADCLGREPRLCDLNTEVFARYSAYIAKRFKSRSTREKYGHYIRRLWRAAFEADLVTDIPDDGRKVKSSLWNRATIEPVAKGDVPVTVRQLYIHFYRPLKLRAASPKTDYQYKINIDSFERFLGREPLLTDFDDEVIGALLSWIVQRGRSTATANKAASHLLALFNFAARKRFVQQFPDVTRLTEPVRIPKAWSETDLRRLFAALYAAPGKIAGVPAGLWWVALHQLLWWTAERIGAVRQLRWSDVDLETGWLIVPAEFRKFQTSDKATELPPAALEALRAIRNPGRTLIFPWPHSDEYLWTVYREIRKRAGMPIDAKSSFHRMRKTAASFFEAAGGNATELLGHSSRAVTMRYLSPAIVKPQQTAGMLFSPGAAPKGGAA
ncbi:MAG TPA: site-specific integrase [Pirellulales bacterium]